MVFNVLRTEVALRIECATGIKRAHEQCHEVCA